MDQRRGLHNVKSAIFSLAGHIAGLSGLAYYVSNEDDPYVSLKDIVSLS